MLALMAELLVALPGATVKNYDPAKFYEFSRTSPGQSFRLTRVPYGNTERPDKLRNIMLIGRLDGHHPGFSLLENPGYIKCFATPKFHRGNFGVRIFT